MIGTLEIKNFKSIRALRLDCKRINVFIGEPNTGKSNILESLAMLSFPPHARGSYLGKFVRYESTVNLFYDEDLDSAIEIKWDANSFSLLFQNGGFQGTYQAGETQLASIGGDHAQLALTSNVPGAMAPHKFYRFEATRGAARFERPESEYLLPPTGDNLVALLVAHKKLRAVANELFSPSGLRLGLRPQEHKVEVFKEYEDVIISYPYNVISETLQRLVFYLAAIHSNKESVLAFEEPESHAFPYHTKYLAEVIALDEADNQYFISTHNPYFLLPLLEKSSKDDVAVFVTFYEDYQTRVKPLSQEEIQDTLEIDIFSNLDRFLKK